MTSNLLPEIVSALSWMLTQPGLAIALVFVTAAALTGFGIPGFIIPLSVLSSVTLGPVASMGLIIMGSAIGSQALFVVLRASSRDKARSLAGARLAHVMAECDKRGFWYSVA
jgi:uncharacterized membrane protein YdjX (TVP38/TMEM64 family)